MTLNKIKREEQYTRQKRLESNRHYEGHQDSSHGLRVRRANVMAAFMNAVIMGNREDMIMWGHTLLHKFGETPEYMNSLMDCLNKSLQSACKTLPSTWLPPIREVYHD